MMEKNEIVLFETKDKSVSITLFVRNWREKQLSQKLRQFN